MMYKILLSCALLVVSATTVLGCDRACTFSSQNGDQCFYTCTNACNQSPAHHKMQFLNALANKGHQCHPNGAASLACEKTPSFGVCPSHSWSCGRGC
ncbi:uncharacterized protein EV154DRAFT_510788 [Mucor mucedo]|uniref:uncharacterized protein n=1 Tax=Mucor mucedo TaxID=29922 RepID=UPI002220A478|nr:uncharacterized protein EV154DRAFT_510788 [Mucor mucedo]KAI7890720.1 hypothetical protein EV154DRAFT_510788 [Mucor mucedo]